MALPGGVEKVAAINRVTAVEGYVLDGAGLLHKTNDYGKTWSMQDLALGKAVLVNIELPNTAMEFTDPQHGLKAGKARTARISGRVDPKPKRLPPAIYNSQMDANRSSAACIYIRLARIDDLPAIVAIYNQAISSKRSTADMDPVRIEDREAWFRDHTYGTHPIFVAEVDGKTAGWCCLSAYRPGRAALRYTAEISYYVEESHQRRGIATALVRHAIAACPDLRIKNLFAIVLEHNASSIRILEKAGFEKWGFLPRVADFEGEECGQYYFGMRIPEKE